MQKPSTSDFDHSFQIDPNPRFFTHTTGANTDLSQRCFNRYGAVTTCDAGCAASDEPAALNLHTLAGTRLSVPTADDDQEPTLEQDIVFKW